MLMRCSTHKVETMNENAQSSGDQPKVLILTPVKNAERYLARYVELIEALDWPASRLSLGMLDSDSKDGTEARLYELEARMRKCADRVTLKKRDFGFHMPDAIPRWAPAFQVARRTVLARARNHLLFAALDNEDWVLWIDVDIVDYPPDAIQRLLAAERDILQPHCVLEHGGPTFDQNGWIDHGKRTLHDMRGSSDPVRMDSVGGSMLFVRADLHRDGLVFPPYKYGVESNAIRDPHPLWGKGEIETEGLAMMARDMGHQCWGSPDFEILHHSS